MIHPLIPVNSASILSIAIAVQITVSNVMNPTLQYVKNVPYFLFTIKHQKYACINYLTYSKTVLIQLSIRIT